MRRRSGLVAVVLAALARAAFAADAIAPFERGGLVPLPPDTCQELRIERTGAGVLEVRFFTEPLLHPSGPDPKTSGASLLLDAADPTRPSLVVYDASGVYARSARIEAPLRWSRTGSELCVASGSVAAACAPIEGELLGSVRIPFGAGWETAIDGCAGFAARERSFADFDPWRLPSPGILAILAAVAVATAFVSGLALFRPHRATRRRIVVAWLGLLAAIAIARIPHPVWVREPVEPIVPPLWIDPAQWHPRAAHQSLAFRDRPLAAMTPDAENWLVLGGSVVFGDGVAAEQTFTAIAQDRLRAGGDPVALWNAGAQGWNIRNIDQLTADLADGLPITGVVLVSILNNATLPIAAPAMERCDRSLLRGWLCTATRNQVLFPWPKAFLPKLHNAERFRSTLAAFLEREQRLGRKVILLDEIADFDRGGLRLWDTDAFRAIAREVAAEHGVPFHDVDRAAAALPPEQRFLDGVHPTPALHLLLGERLAEILRAR